MKIYTNFTMLLLVLFAIGCSKDEDETSVVAESSAKQLTSFVFNAADNPAFDANLTSTIDESAKTISASVPFGTTISALVPSLTISAKASVSPSGAQNFTSPVTYTVTAEDGSTIAYRASVTIMPSDAKQLIAFEFNAENNEGIDEDISAEINEEDKTVAVLVPNGTDVTKLTPSIVVSAGATYTPEDESDFTEAVVYKVEAQDKSVVEYTVTVEVSISQKEALIAIFNANPNNRLTWVFEDEIDTWDDIEVDENGMVNYLNLNRKNIKVLPEEIGSLTSLVELDLGDHNLATLPAAIGKLINLENLNLEANQSFSKDGFGFTSLPVEIGKLTKLKSLNLNNSRLTELPSEIGNLTNLIELKSRYGVLNSIPTEIGKLVNLTLFDFTDNELKSIPSSIGQLSNLENLWLSINQITEIPTEIGQLINLKSLTLTSNQLVTLPISVGQLTNLETLLLSNNQLNSLPEQIKNLTKLEFLSLSSNQLSKFDVPNLASLTNLKYLFLNDISFGEIPFWVVNNSDLRVLSMTNCNLTDLPSGLWQLNNLRELYLSENQITEISPRVNQLTNLKNLDLGNNQLTEIPPELGAITNMFKLYFDNNKLTGLPIEITQLQGPLAILDIENNNIITLPNPICDWIDNIGFVRKDEGITCSF